MPYITAGICNICNAVGSAYIAKFQIHPLYYWVPIQILFILPDKYKDYNPSKQIQIWSGSGYSGYPITVRAEITANYFQQIETLDQFASNFPHYALLRLGSQPG